MLDNLVDVPGVIRSIIHPLFEVDATNGEIKFASATFQLVEPPEFKVKLEKQ